MVKQFLTTSTRAALVLFFVLCGAHVPAKAQPAADAVASAELIIPKAHEPVELMSIASRLAGFQEYSAESGGVYIEDIRLHFNEFRTHPFIEFMQEIRKSNSIAYDAVMSMAVRLERGANGFVMVEEEEQGLDARWEGVDLAQFLTLLEDFYCESNFHAFFTAHQELYAKGLQSYTEQVMKYMDTSWYTSFYGREQAEDFTVIIAFNNGNGNYGPSRHVKGARKEVFAIVSYAVEEDGTPAYGKGYTSTLVHEFNHSFINYILETHNEYRDQLSGPIGSLFPTIAWAMQQQAYGRGATVVNESLVRAAVICYMMDHPDFYQKGEVTLELAAQLQFNFRWMPELVCLFREYASHRDTYPTFESFYPRIVTFFTEYSRSEDQRLRMIWE